MKTILPRNKCAVTFIELLLVIVIMGILVGISTPQLRKTLDNFKLENFVKDIYYLVLYLQANAISQVKIHSLNIDPHNKEFQATYRKEEGFIPLKGRYGKIYRVPNGATLALDPPDKTTLYFYPDGSIDNIIITFSNKYKKQLSLSIQGSLGEIKIQ